MKVLTVGGAMIDTIAIIENSAIERMSLQNAGASFLLLEDGRKTEALDISMHCGGGAINTSIAFARLGFDCATLVKLGDDRRADQIIARLDEEGVSTRWIKRDARAPTGSSVMVSSHDRNAAVFTFRGANTLLSADDVDVAAFAVDLVYIANLSNEAAIAFPRLVEAATSNGACVAANPGTRQLHAHGDDFVATLPHIGILSLNRREAEDVIALLNHASFARSEARGETALAFPHHIERPALAGRGLRRDGRALGIRDFFRALIAAGVRSIVLTDGKDGAFAATKDGVFYCQAVNVEVAGTAGAGDAFGATFAAYMAQGFEPAFALSAATLNAASVLGFIDTQTGLMRRKELDTRLAEAAAIPNVIGWPL